MRIAMTRAISPSLERCELSHLERVPIDLERARAQHRDYEACLVESGCRLVQLPADPGMPDSVFIEDTAVVLDELAIITRPGAISRRAETATVAERLARYRRLVRIETPATIDGGDVLCVGRRIFIGRSGRTDQAAVTRMREILEPIGYTVEAVEVSGCLHLKSAVTRLAGNTLLINREWVDAEAFTRMTLIDVDPAEPHAANVLLIGDVVIASAAHPRTRRRLVEHGVAVRVLDASELAKAEGGLTCCSLIFEDRTS